MRFQQYLKSQIIKIALVTLSISLLVFYTSLYFYNQHYHQTRLQQNNAQIEERFRDLEKSLSYYHQQYFQLESYPAQAIYPLFYKMNRNLNQHLDVLIYQENTLIFSSQSTLASRLSSYLSILFSHLDTEGKGKLNVHLQEENVLLHCESKGPVKTIFVVHEEDLLTFLHSKLSFALVDSYNQVLCASPKEFVNYLNRFEIPKDSLYVFQKKNVDSFSIYSYAYHQTMFEMKWIGFILLFAGGFLTLFLNLYSKKVSEKSASSLQLLLEEMNQVKQEKHPFIQDIHTEDEFEDLAKEMNLLLESVKGLNEKNTELLELNKLIEMKQLESQFNPHFLYNTLETIRYCVYVNPNQADDLILKLTRILRYSINPQEDRVPLEKDIAYIENYLEICKVRFQGHFDYTLKIQEECRLILLPKLILQPVIENSIKHNFKTKTNLSIWVTMEVIQNRLVIEVEDNGDGIKESMIQELNQHDPQSRHIGLNNVYRRLQLYYSNEFQFHIYSRLGIGTKVSISIPVQEVNHV